jgi:Domain of unknown function (DUF1841)
MPFFHDLGRDRLREMYADAWRRHRQGLPLEPLHAQIVAVIELHPEYHALLESGAEALARDYTPDGGATNPFLHMGLHLAIREQVGTDRPAGIRAVHAALTRRLGDEHAAEHRMIECLAEALWQSQGSGRPSDEAAYLAALRRAAGLAG